jgi:hypothetical protein
VRIRELLGALHVDAGRRHEGEELSLDRFEHQLGPPRWVVSASDEVTSSLPDCGCYWMAADRRER